MGKIKKYAEIDFLSAVRRGMSSAVISQMNGWNFSQRTFYDENEEETVPFAVALEHQRWGVALDLIEHRHTNPELLPQPYEEDPEHPVDPGPSVADTPYKMAVNQLLAALRRNRSDKPLPVALQSRLLALTDPLIEEHGVEATLGRCLGLGPRWIGWPAKLLDQDINANAFFANKINGRTIHLLEMAGRGGFEGAFDRLLELGADPWYKHHDFDLAIHRIADLNEWPVDEESKTGLPMLKVVASRKHCLDRLLKIEGMDKAVDIQGRTAGQIWQKSMDWLASRQPMVAEAGVAEAWHARRMDLISFQDVNVTNKTPNRPRM